MRRFSNLALPKGRLILFFLSCLGATAFYCNQPQLKSILTGGNNKSDATQSALPSGSLMALVIGSQTPQMQQEKDDRFSRSSIMLSERNPSLKSLGFGNPRNKPGCRCPENEENYDDDESEDLEDRREALFAAMGGLWAVATTTSVSSAVLGFPEASLATAGVDAKMAFPDVVGGMNDRNTKQCLVESLGNRECMVYKETDPDKLLYKGVDAQQLLDRTKKATAALGEIPALVEKKKWNDINGILIGPMGELSSTLTLLSKDDATKTKLARKVKEDLFAMGTATTQRQQDVILKYHAAATKDLSKFLEVAL
eukprot:CAMPEP_0197270314 /NCGR_PEP_ID=MMETSP1432-20130617/6959_1 /TAXON_ID=44447 /ORGANISM="Pseudo-nitzschia delicatissima, Strain UNC1205" /LENGTH=310 /DNA_ID=CAMNT_0042735595 /DNA_START=149 /DNA_END=1081 /DNA_ORIENTATION=-